MELIQKISQTYLGQKIIEKKFQVGLGLATFYFAKKIFTLYRAITKDNLSQKQLDTLKNNFLQRRQKQIDLIVTLIKKVKPEVQEEIISLPTLKLAQAIKDGKFSCEEVFLTFAYRACTIGVELNLICDVDIENNLKLAQEKDIQLKGTEDKSTLPAFFGIPITVKEHLRTKGLVASCGYIQLSGRAAETTDCSFVQILREEQGVIPFASTNVPQGLFAIESNNNLYGRALNPLNHKFTVGGSSGGEGGAQAARLSAFGISSDSLGSTRIPAAFCGVFSFKGTGKRVSLKGRYGITGSDVGGFKDISTSIGPISQYVDDIIEIEKTVLGNFNRIDNEAPPLFWNQKEFEETNLKNVKIGVVRNIPNCPNTAAVENTLNEVLSKLKEQGADLHEINDLPLEQMSTQIYKLLATPGVQAIIYKTLRGEQILKIHEPYVKMKLYPNWLNKVIEFILSSKGKQRELNFIRTQKTNDFLGHMGESIKLDMIKKNISDYLKENNIDILISPVLPFPAMRHDDGGELLQFLGLPGLANVLDMPAGVVPIRNVTAEEANPLKYIDLYEDKYTEIIRKNVELSQNMPVSVQVASMTWKDEICLKIMKEISQIFNYQNKQIS